MYKRQVLLAVIQIVYSQPLEVEVGEFLEIGYAGTAYHAWISTHIDGLGWVNGIIHFDGSTWTLMDPTFAANSAADDLKDFIGNGENYQTKCRPVSTTACTF